MTRIKTMAGGYGARTARAPVKSRKMSKKRTNKKIKWLQLRPSESSEWGPLTLEKNSFRQRFLVGRPQLNKKMSNEKSLKLPKEQASKAIQAATELTVETDEQYQSATELLTKIKKVQKLIQAEADKVIKPAKEIVKIETAKWKPILDEASEAESIVKRKMIAYVDAKEEEQRAKEREIQRKLEAGRIKPETALKKAEQIDAAPKKVESVNGGASVVTKIKKVHIVNPDLVPDEYWVLDEVKIRKVALAGVEIPGVEVRLETNIAGSAR